MLCVLWLGSSVGNLKPHEAVGFFQSVQESSGPNTQVSMQPMFVVQTHNFNFLPFLRITVGQNIVQTQYAYSITHYISQDPLQETACIVHHSPIMLACCSLRCHDLLWHRQASLGLLCRLHSTTSIHGDNFLNLADLPVHRPVERCQDFACSLL